MPPKHVKYELDMLARTTSFLSKGRGETDQATWNAYLESFLLHVRNLIEFFYLPGMKKGLILAEHYVSDVAERRSSRHDRTHLLKDAELRVNNLGHHLTYMRLALDMKWQFADLQANLEQVFNCFLKHLPPDRAAWFAGAGTHGPTGPTGTPSPTGGVGWTGPPEPPGSAGGMVSN